MLRSNYTSALAQAVHRRNLWIAVALAMGFSNVLLSCKLATTSTAEKTIVVPPVVEKQFWVQGNAVSPEYLEMMGSYFAGLALSYTKENIDAQTTLFLRFTDPTAFGELSSRLKAEAERVKRANLASVFYPVSLRMREKEQRIAISGDLVTMVGEQITSRRRATFAMQMVYRNGRLFVSEFKEAANETNPFDTDAAAPAAGSQ